MSTRGGADQTGPAALRRILLNLLSLLGAYVVPRAFTFASAIVAARLLGVEAFGVYGTAAALAVMLSIVTTLGMMQLLVREIAREPGRAAELLGAANVAKTGSALLMMAALVGLVAGPLDYAPEVVACTLLLGTSYVLVTYIENLGAYFQAMERMGVWMQAQTVFGVVSGGAAIALAVGTRSVVWFAAAPLLGQAMALGWLVRSAPRDVRWAWGGPPALVLRLLRALVPFTLYVVALTVYAKVDVLLLERWRGLAEAGVYAAAYKFVDLGQALALVVATAVYPRLSRAATAGPSRPASDPAAGRTAELVLLAGVPAAAALWVLREPVVALVFGPEYVASAPVLGILAVLLPVLALDTVGGFVLAASGRMGTVAGLYGGALALALVLNAVLVPGLGARGAALARLGAELALAVPMLIALRRACGVSPSPKVLAAVAAVVVASALAPRVAADVGVALAIVGVSTTAAYLVLGVVPRREWRLLRKAVAG